ncbi:MAG: S-layer homology domain-containing protein [Oscillospiraceae bacterium]|nr:S-layer homology domain-containing protein [Oscillospiraceae bacterium]
MNAKRILAVVLCLAMLGSMVSVAAAPVAVNEATETTTVVDLLAGPWVPNLAGVPNVSGGNGSTLHVAAPPNGSAVADFRANPITLADFAEMSLEIDMTVTGGPAAYVVLWLVTEETGRWNNFNMLGGGMQEITPVLLPAIGGGVDRSNHEFRGVVNDIIAFDRPGDDDTNFYFSAHSDVTLLGFLVQLSNGATAEVRTLNIIGPNGGQPVEPVTSPFDVLTLPASAWGTNPAGGGTVTTTGGAGAPLVMTSAIGWPSATMLFPAPVEVAGNDRELFFDFDIAVGEYVRIHAVDSEGDYIFELTLEALTDGNQVGSITIPAAAADPMYGLWIQIVGGGTVTVNRLSVGDARPLPTSDVDTPNSWALPYMRDALEMGIVGDELPSGVGFRPDAPRWYIAELLADFMVAFSIRTGRLPANSNLDDVVDAWLAVPGNEPFDTSFPDVPSTHPRYDQIMAMATMGVIRGGTFNEVEGLFGPDFALTRAEAAVGLTRMMEALGVDVEGYPTLEDVFDDWPPTSVAARNIPSWALESVSFMYYWNIMGNTSSLENIPTYGYIFNAWFGFQTQQLITGMVRMMRTAWPDDEPSTGELFDIADYDADDWCADGTVTITGGSGEPHVLARAGGYATRFWLGAEDIYDLPEADWNDIYLNFDITTTGNGFEVFDIIANGVGNFADPATPGDSTGNYIVLRFEQLPASPISVADLLASATLFVRNEAGTGWTGDPSVDDFGGVFSLYGLRLFVNIDSSVTINEFYLGAKGEPDPTPCDEHPYTIVNFTDLNLPATFVENADGSYTWTPAQAWAPWTQLYLDTPVEIPVDRLDDAFVHFDLDVAEAAAGDNRAMLGLRVELQIGENEWITRNFFRAHGNSAPLGAGRTFGCNSINWLLDMGDPNMPGASDVAAMRAFDGYFRVIGFTFISDTPVVINEFRVATDDPSLEPPGPGPGSDFPYNLLDFMADFDYTDWTGGTAGGGTVNVSSGSVVLTNVGGGWPSGILDLGDLSYPRLLNADFDDIAIEFDLTIAGGAGDYVNLILQSNLGSGASGFTTLVGGLQPGAHTGSVVLGDIFSAATDDLVLGQLLVQVVGNGWVVTIDELRLVAAYDDIELHEVEDEPEECEVIDFLSFPLANWGGNPGNGFTPAPSFDGDVLVITAAGGWGNTYIWLGDRIPRADWENVTVYYDIYNDGTGNGHAWWAGNDTNSWSNRMISPIAAGTRATGSMTLEELLVDRAGVNKYGFDAALEGAGAGAPPVDWLDNGLPLSFALQTGSSLRVYDFRVVIHADPCTCEPPIEPVVYDIIPMMENSTILGGGDPARLTVVDGVATIVPAGALVMQFPAITSFDRADFADYYLHFDFTVEERAGMSIHHQWRWTNASLAQVFADNSNGTMISIDMAAGVFQGYVSLADLLAAVTFSYGDNVAHGFGPGTDVFELFGMTVHPVTGSVIIREMRITDYPGKTTPGIPATSAEIGQALFLQDNANPTLSRIPTAFAGDTVNLAVGQRRQLTETVLPADTTDDAAWSTSNAAVATISDAGVITAVGNGTATITLAAGAVSDTIVVNVTTPNTENMHLVVENATAVAGAGAIPGAVAIPFDLTTNAYLVAEITVSGAASRVDFIIGFEGVAAGAGARGLRTEHLGMGTGLWDIGTHTIMVNFADVLANMDPAVDLEAAIINPAGGAFSLGTWVSVAGATVVIDSLYFSAAPPVLEEIVNVANLPASAWSVPANVVVNADDTVTYTGTWGWQYVLFPEPIYIHTDDWNDVFFRFDVETTGTTNGFGFGLVGNAANTAGWFIPDGESSPGAPDINRAHVNTAYLDGSGNFNMMPDGTYTLTHSLYHILLGVPVTNANMPSAAWRTIFAEQGGYLRINGFRVIADGSVTINELSILAREGLFDLGDDDCTECGDVLLDATAALTTAWTSNEAPAGSSHTISFDGDILVLQAPAGSWPSSWLWDGTLIPRSEWGNVAVVVDIHNLGAGNAHLNWAGNATQSWINNAISPIAAGARVTGIFTLEELLYDRIFAGGYAPASWQDDGFPLSFSIQGAGPIRVYDLSFVTICDDCLSA